MDFGKPIQKVIDTILGNDSAPSTGSDAPSSDGAGFSVSKSLFGDEADQSDAAADSDANLLPEPAEDIPMEPHAMLEGSRQPLVIWALDEWRKPMPRAPYRLRVGEDVRLGHADENGRIEEPDLIPSEFCVLSWGEPMDDRDGFTYVRELYWDMEDVDDTERRKLHNLAYFGASTAERLAQFQADYGNSLDNVHETEGDHAVSAADSAFAAGDSDNPYGSEDDEDDSEDELA